MFAAIALDCSVPRHSMAGLNLAALESSHPAATFLHTLSSRVSLREHRNACSKCGERMLGPVSHSRFLRGDDGRERHELRALEPLVEQVVGFPRRHLPL